MQELAKQFRHIMNNKPIEGFTILSFFPRPSGTKVTEPSFKPYSIKRFSDEEIFTIGDTVTNGTPMVGQITSFEMLDGKVFVNHTWSGVGMDLDSLTKTIKLPSRHQIGDSVWLNLWSAKVVSEIHSVHFYKGKVKYDLIVFGENGDQTRLYNIDSIFVDSK